MTIQSKTYGKSSGRTHSDVVAGYDVPFSALDLSLSFDTMETKSTIENLEGEIWKPVLGFEGLYEASNMGRVKNLNYHNTGKVKLVKPTKSRHYLQVYLQNGKIKKRPVLQRIVYEAFYGKLPEWKPSMKRSERKEVNHKDENKLNNRLDNLELITGLENTNYGTHNQRVSKSMTNGKTSRKVYQYDTNGNLIKIWPSTMECKRNGYVQSSIWRCCVGRRNFHKGYIWSYEPLKIESK